jgi:hypothetical protein
MRGVLGIIAGVVILWGLWMSWEWLRNPENWKKKDKEDK